MAIRERRKKKQYYTVEQANAMLPLLRSILRDVTALAHQLADRHDHLAQIQDTALDEARREELRHIENEQEADKTRMRDYLVELESLGVELKDPFIGLVDWRALMNDHEVYLCWKLDEPEVGHWHELDAGFLGRQKLMVEA